MNKLFSILIVLLTSNAFAAGALNYQCGGNLLTGDQNIPIAFDINYTDWKPGVGYTNEILTVKSPATAVTGIDLGIFRTNVSNNSECFSLNELELQGSNGNEYYKFELSFKCSADLTITGYCGKL